MDDANNAPAREGTALLYTALCDQVGHACEPQLVQLLFSLLVLQGDKVVPVKMAAEGACRALLSALCPHGIRSILQSEWLPPGVPGLGKMRSQEVLDACLPQADTQGASMYNDAYMFERACRKCCGLESF